MSDSTSNSEYEIKFLCSYKKLIVLRVMLVSAYTQEEGDDTLNILFLFVKACIFVDLKSIRKLRIDVAKLVLNRCSTVILPRKIIKNGRMARFSQEHMQITHTIYDVNG